MSMGGLSEMDLSIGFRVGVLFEQQCNKSFYPLTNFPNMSSSNSWLSLISDDILRSVLHEWIGSRDTMTLLAVDDAMCDRFLRQKYLLCLQGKKMIFCSSEAISENILSAFKTFEDWCVSKRLLIGKIDIASSCLFVKDIDWKRYSNSLYSIALNDISETSIYDYVSSIDEWSDENENEEVDVGVMVSLPCVKTLELNSGLMATCSLPQNIEPSPDVCLERMIMYLPLRTAEFVHLINFLGNHAKKLTYLKFFCHRFGDFQYILQQLPSLEKFHCEMQRELPMGARSMDFPLCPNMKRLNLEHIPDELLIPFLRKCPNLESLEMIKSHVSKELERVLVSIIPQLKQYYLYGLSTTASFLKAMPISHVKETNVTKVSDSMLPLVVSKFPAVEELVFFRGKLSSLSPLLTSSSPSSSPRLLHLIELGFDETDMPDFAYKTFFAQAHHACPALRKLYISLPTDSTICKDRESLFVNALQSPLHQQVTRLTLLNFLSPKKIKKEKKDVAIPWNTVPVWQKLKVASFAYVPTLRLLAEWFQRTPQLQSFAMPSNLFPALGTAKELSTDEKCMDVCHATFKHVPQLRFFTCRVSGKEKKAKLEFWLSMLYLCESLHKLHVTQEEDPDDVYWNAHFEANMAAQIISIGFKYRLQLDEVTARDIEQISV